MAIDCISTCSLPLNSGTLSKLGYASEGIHPPEQAGEKSWDMLSSPGGCSLKLRELRASGVRYCQAVAVSAADSTIRT